MARLSHDSSSDDEFPSLQVIARRVRQQAAARSELSTTDRENAPTKDLTTRVGRQERAGGPGPLSKGTPLRRRKLGDAQVPNNPLFRKWSEDVTKSTSNSARPSRVSSREYKRTASEIPERLPRKPENSVESSDDDVFVRRRKPAIKPAAQKPTRERAGGCIKTEAVVSVIVLDDDARTIEETMEISAIISEGETQSSSGEESGFVTALSGGEESESNYESPSELDFVPMARRSKSPSLQRLNPVQLAPPKAPSRKEAIAKRPLAKQKGSNDDFYGQPPAPQTPPRGKTRSRKSPAKTSSLADDFEKLKPYADYLDGSPETEPHIQLDPATPNKTLQASPIKAPQIPLSPWKVDHKEFWDVEIQNEWIDRHSPPKRSFRKLDLMTDSDEKKALKEKYGTSPEKRDAKKAFNQVKERLAQDFLQELDECITSGQLCKLTTDSGGLRIRWSTSLQTTAGRAHWKGKEVSTMIQQPDGSFKSTRHRKHEAWIELAAKVLNKEDDLLNTVAHEFCHLAVFMLNGTPKSAHGAEFKSWGRKCMAAFKSRGIEVTTKHNYEIDFKFIWRCADCACEIKRHSKSIDPVKQKCGRCHGTLEQVKPVPRVGVNGKGKSAYQEFVSKEMKALKAESRALSFKEMMATISSRWRAQQQDNKDSSASKDMRDLEKQLHELLVVNLESD